MMSMMIFCLPPLQLRDLHLLPLVLTNLLVISSQSTGHLWSIDWSSPAILLVISHQSTGHLWQIYWSSLTNLLVISCKSTGHLWSIYWLSLTNLLVFSGHSTVHHQPIYWSSPANILVITGRSIGHFWTIYWTSLDNLLDIWTIHWTSLTNLLDIWTIHWTSLTNQLHLQPIYWSSDQSTVHLQPICWGRGWEGVPPCDEGDMGVPPRKFWNYRRQMVHTPVFWPFCLAFFVYYYMKSLPIYYSPSLVKYSLTPPPWPSIKGNILNENKTLKQSLQNSSSANCQQRHVCGEVKVI